MPAIDLSEEKKLHEDDKFKALIEYSYDIVTLVDTNATILYSSPSVERVLGFTPGEVVGKNAILELVHPDDMKTTKEKLGLLLMFPDKLQTAQFRIKRKDGSWIWAEATGRNLLSNPDVKAIVVNYHDITKEKALDHAKDEFVSIASHELRTPMTAVRGFLSMILGGDYGEVPEKFKSPLKEMSDNVDRLLYLVNDILDVSRIQSGRVIFTLTTFDIEKIASDVVSSLQSIAIQKNVKLIYRHDGMLNIKADAGKTRQIFENIIGNALKYTNKGEIEVWAKAENNFALVLIKDTGIGISKEGEEKLFNRFEQISSTADGKPKGNGLGLYISREFARKMGGDIKLLESSPQKGSTFEISFPLV